MPTGIAFCADLDVHTKEMVEYFAQMVFMATGEVVCIDLIEAPARSIAGAPDIVNTNILNVFFFHGGQLISPEMEEKLCAQFTAHYDVWRVLITTVVTPRWWANGEQV